MKTPKRLKEPLAAAIRDVLQPVISPFGFVQYSSRILLKVATNDLVQLIAFDKPRGMWYASYNTIPLFQPLLPESKGIYLGPPGIRFNRVLHAKNHDAADREMRDVVNELNQGVLEWFTASSTIEGLAKAFDNPRHGGFPHQRGYYKALCFARLERIQEAIQLLEPHFECFNDIMEARIRDLHAALRAGTHRTMLDGWTQAYRSLLKLK